MLEKIKKKLLTKYDPNENKGLFFSGFDKNKNMVFSDGVINTDKSLQDLIDFLYHGIVEKHIKNINYLVCDVVSNITELTNPTHIFNSSVKDNGFYLVSLDGKKSGVILPDTGGVADAKNALYLVKKKYNIEGKVKVYSFKTDRLIINK